MLGQAPLNAAKQKSPRSAVSISTARPVNTAAPKSKVNDALPKTYSYFKAIHQVNSSNTAGPKAVVSAAVRYGETVRLKDQGILDSGCSRHMAGNKSFLTDYPEVDGGFVAFAGCPKGAQELKDELTEDAGKKTNEEPANEGERNGQENEGGASNKEDDQNDTANLLKHGNFSGDFDDEAVGA
ncbi:hypothetical protein Tco_1507848 [Tanacetum coccineum]